MVEITYSPLKSLVVHDILEIDKESIMRSRVTPAGTMPLYWCDGFLYSFSSLPMSDEVVKDYLNGRIHWAEVQFARLDKFEPVLMLNEEEYKAEMKIRVMDTSISQLHKEFVKWLKSVTKKK
jgi:hypothetical protein